MVHLSTEYISERIAFMNAMYELGKVSDIEECAIRSYNFDKIISEELEELEDVTDRLDQAIAGTPNEGMNAKVDMADFIADMMVYLLSEAQRWDIPIWEVFKIVMDSNASKLGADGKPIKDLQTGKFLKGPNYWKPEAKIKELMFPLSRPYTSQIIED